MQSKVDPRVRFGLHLVNHPCKVVKVYDGDSVTLVWPREGPHDTQLCYANTRLYGIDTPELRGTKGRQRSDAEACRDALRDLILGHMFLFSTVGPTGLDKYGRPLVVIRPARGITPERIFDEIRPHGTLNDWALKILPGCQPYFGGTKGLPELEERRAIRREDKLRRGSAAWSLPTSCTGVLPEVAEAGPCEREKGAAPSAGGADREAAGQ